MENALAIAGFGPFVVNEIVVWCKKFFKQRECKNAEFYVH
jgi:hypothetical protein